MPPKKEKSSVYKEYILLTIDCKKKYGPKTIVLYRSGIFYEVYSKVGDDVSFDEFLKVLSFKYSTNAQGVRLAGINWPSLYDEHLDTLIEAGFTVVVSEKDPKRHIADVITPGTHLPSKGSQSNKLCVVCFTEGSTKSSSIVVVGIATIDSTTGRSTVDEFVCTSVSEVQNTLPEYMNCVNPKEIIFISSKLKKQTLSIQDLERVVPRSTLLTKDKLSKLPPEFENESYIRSLLTKVFPPKNALDVLEECGVDEMISGRKAYAYLLHYVYDQNEKALKGIDYPGKIKTETSRMRLTTFATKHLSFEDLEDILNKTKTAMGKRLFSDRIRLPMTSVEQINRSYNLVQELVPHSTNIRAHLERAYDLERCFRLMERNRLHPCDIWRLLSTLETSVLIKKMVPNTLNLGVEEVEKCVAYVHNHINVHIIHGVKLHTITDSLFQTNIHKHIDALQNSKDGVYSKLKQIQDVIPHCKIERGAKEYSLRITKTKWDEIKCRLEGEVDCGNGKILNLEKITTKQNRSEKSFDLTHKVLEELFVSLLRYDDQIAIEVAKAYTLFISTFVNTFRNLIKTIITFIAEIDWYSNLAHISQLYNHKRPVCVESDKSYIKLTNARHPIVEVVEERVSCVPHSLYLTPEESCIVLYGVNASGKSTTAKMVGLLVVMAQCGMFVPAENMEFSPYDTLSARAPTGDNIMKGKSTFEVEAGELREIVKNCDHRSLVIGDELCSGTESESATAIVAKGLCRLREKGASVIFATHYHTLTKLRKIQELMNSKAIRIYHHSVIWDEEKKILIYDRLLKEGQGSSLYGLEVCKSLGFDEDFLEGANEFRKELAGLRELQNPKSSQYNSKLKMDLCAVCGVNPASETHHIKRQELADENGFIGHEHKNRLSNLTSICSSCHEKETFVGESLVGYVKTSEGIKLLKKEVVPNNRTKEYPPEVLEKVKELSAKGYSTKRISIECGLTQYAVKKIVQS